MVSRSVIAGSCETGLMVANPPELLMLKLMVLVPGLLGWFASWMAP